MGEPKVIGDWLNVMVLGSGGFGVVTLWRNQKSQEHIAIKKCKWELPNQVSPKQRDRWTKEVEIMCAINHQNIVSYRPLPDILANTLSRYNPSKLPLLSMEYCSSGNLRHYLKNPKNACGLPEVEVRYILKDLNDAVSYLHSRRITHRDLKPENIVLQKTDSRPTETMYKLIDLGYVKELGTQVASFVGTMLYLAPEIFKNEAYGNNVDYWSFGIVAFEVICGKYPFLLKLNPVERLTALEKKSSDDICLYSSRSGQVVCSKEIFKENHVSYLLKNHLERWLRIVLRYDPKERGVTETGRNVFAELQDILSKKIVRVFSVFNYCYFYYEVDEGTLLKTFQEWLKSDSDIAVGDQLLIAENMFYDDNPQRKLLDCLDETNANSTLVLFKRGHFVRSPDCTIPLVVKNLMRNSGKECSSTSLYPQITDSVHFIFQETDLMFSLKKSCTTLYYYLKSLMKRETDVFNAMRDTAQKILTQIGLFKHVDSEVIAGSVSSEHLKKYKKCLWQSRELVENVNAATCRHSRLLAKEGLLKAGSVLLEENLNKQDPTAIFNAGLSCMDNKQSVISSDDIIKVLSNCCQSRFKLLTNSFTRKYLEVCGKSLKEIQRLLRWMNALRISMEKMSFVITDNHVDMLKKLVNTQEVRNLDCEDVDYTLHDLLQENITLRCSFQDAMTYYLSAHKEYATLVEEASVADTVETVV